MFDQSQERGKEPQTTHTIFNFLFQVKLDFDPRYRGSVHL